MMYRLIFFMTFYAFGSCHYGLKDSRSNMVCNETFKTPMNNNCSISYLLFTEDNRNSPCYLEPKFQEFRHCNFDSSRETKILIPGYTVKLKPGNVFELIKDSLLLVDPYNVIIVNWTLYNQGEYNEAVKNAYLVGIEVGKFINFLTSKKGVNPASVHLIGHSLGAHICGVAGKQNPNLKRITGLDPAAPSYEKNVTYNRLTDSDADFVDVIHCSNGEIAYGSKGFGMPFPIGNLNFYPNGGVYQPSCKLFKNFTNADSEVSYIKSNIDLVSCRHDICPRYFLYSIRDCQFLSTECGSYKRYNMGKCFSISHPTEVMGLYAQPISGLPNHSKLYLNTTADAPYCDCI